MAVSQDLRGAREGRDSVAGGVREAFGANLVDLVGITEQLWRRLLAQAEAPGDVA